MIEIVLTSSILILLLALLRRALRGRIDPRVQYALWLLVAARLLIPGTLFTAPVSVMGTAEELRTTIRETYPDPNTVPVSPPAAIQTPPAAKPAGDAEAPVEFEIPQPTLDLRWWDFVDWQDVIWKAGMAVTGGVMAASNLVFYLRLRRTRKRLTLPAAPWTGRLPVYEAEGLPSPCLFGLLRPAVYLNGAAMDAEHPEHVLAHEYAHYRHGDHLWSILRSICLVIHWYNPLVWWAAVLCRRDCELACDEAALRRLGETERIDYGQTLLGMISRRAAPAALFQTATTMTAGKRAMKERIALIVQRPKMRKATLIAVVLAACILVSCTFGGRGARVEATRLLEFPGLHWNDSVETVLEALDISEDQILEQGELDDSGDNWAVVAESVPAFGGMAEKAFFYFQRYEGSEWGLYYVRLDYPDDAGFGAVREELVRQYGPGGETAADAYIFTSGGQLQKSSQKTSLEPGSGFEQLMLDIYGQEMLDRREEIREQPGPHSWHWSLDSGALPEEFVTRAAGWFSENAYSGVSLEAAREYFRLQPMVRVFWTDAAPLNWSKLSTTLNQVCLDASEYVFFLQRTAGTSLAAGDPRLLEFPGLRWNDSVETVMNALGVTEDQFVETGENDSDSTYEWSFIISDFPYGGSTAQYAFFDFLQYKDTGAELGLHRVRLYYPDDDEDFGAVREELVRQYGPGNEGTGGTQYGPMVQKQLGDRYARWEELQKQGGIRSMLWEAGLELLPEELRGDAEAAYRRYLDWTGSSETFEEYAAQKSLAKLEWSNCALWGPTFCSVWFSGGGYVFYLQNAGRYGDGLPSAVTVSQGLSALATDTSYITDPAEVARLWELYQSFEYEGSYDDPSGTDAWPITVSFRYGDTLDDRGVFFILDQSGIFRDGESLRLKDIDAIYAEFLRVSEDPAYPPGPDPAGDALQANARSIVEQIQQGADVSEWLPLMSCMDWGVLARAAVEAGMDEGDGSTAVTGDIMWPIDQYIERQGTDLTQAEYLYILSATAGLDGAPTEGYAYTLYLLYNMDPSRFAYVVLEMLPEEQRNEAIDLFCFEWSSYQVSTGPEGPTREDAIAQLEADLEAGVSITPASTTLTSPGETFHIMLHNTTGIYALTYTSSDPSVAKVDDDGTVTAVSPGEAVITMDYEGAGGPKQLTCRVTCAWEDGTDAQAASWRQWFRAYMDAVPAAPAGEIIYDNVVVTNLHDVVKTYLYSYAMEYFGTDFARNCSDYEVQLAFDVPDHLTQPQLEVSYRVDVLASFTLPDGALYSEKLTSRELKTALTATPSGETINSWGRTFFGFVFGIPSMPDQELIYDSMEEGGLEKAVLSVLGDYYREYVAQHGNSEHNDRFNRIILESDIPASAGYGEQITVSYQVECLSEREVNGTIYSLAPQPGEHLATNFTVMDQMTVMDQALVDGAAGDLTEN